ncbi:MAG: AAA family ATPase [Polyangiales bacterium]
MLTPRIHGYQLGRIIHSSPATIVVRAVRDVDQAQVVLKFPATEHPSLGEVARYRHELTLLRLLDGPAIVRAFELVQADHRFVIVSEDLHCVTLNEYFGERATDLGEFLRVASALARALAIVHDAGVIHKDINPANVLITPDGAVKLIDFGISTRLPRQTQGIAHPGTLEGTLAYMAPEQTGRMNSTIDRRSDLYSTGVTLYTLLAGRRPFESDDPVGYVHAHIALDPPSLGELAPHVPPPLAAIITKLMAKSPDERYQSARGLAIDLEHALQEWRAHGTVAPFALGSGDVVLRFEVPHVLYGRDDEVAKLLEVFDRAAQGTAELLLVGGYSGIGKSALVHEVQKPIVARRGYFAAGKFDQYNRNVPYSALSAAFRELVHYLLMEPPERVSEWRRLILGACGANGRVLVDVIPALELLIGPQAPMPAVSQVEASHRFNQTFQRFSAVLARPAHPLVLFLDDVQWADTPSLRLLETLLSAADKPALLVIAAYRDNEVDPAHPAMQLVEQLRHGGASVHAITLGPLRPTDTRNLIADALHTDTRLAAPLAELLHGRTGGNPFFLVQLLASLEHAGLVTLDAEGSTFKWDLAAIRAHGLTGDVITLLAARLRELPEPTRELLKLAACMGDHFDLAILSALVGSPFEATEQTLWPALAEELVVPAEARRRGATHRLTRYRFLHDRVQQAAYALLEDGEREEVRHKLAWLLLAVTPDDQLDAVIFDIVAHLNSALERIPPADRERVALLNVRAGRRAKAASAHRTAASNFAVAMQLLGAELWSRDYTLAFDLHRERAECEYVAGRFDVADDLAKQGLVHSRSTLDAARLYSPRVLMRITDARFAEATELGLEALQRFGYELNGDAARRDAITAAQAARVRTALGEVDIERLTDAPEMRDPEKRALMTLLVDVWCATYFSGNTQINQFTVDLMVGLSLEHGHTAESAFGYTVLGTRFSLAGDARTAYKLGALGIRLNERLPNLAVTLRAGNMFANSINFYVNHLETNLAHYRRSYEIGPRVGDLIYTVWAVNFMLLLKVMKGDPLAEVYDEGLTYLDFLRQSNDLAILNTYTLQLQMIRALRGLTAGRNLLDEGDFSERSAVARHIETKFAPGVLFYVSYRAGVHVVFRDYRKALALAPLATEGLASDLSLWTTTNHYFYQALAECGVYNETPTSEQPKLLTSILEKLAKLERWAETGPANFAHRRDLVAAELARCAGDGDRAARLYDLSLDAAKANRFVNDAALAAEAAAHFHGARGSALAARSYLAEAQYAYMRWGADAKVAELRLQYPELDQVLTGGGTQRVIEPTLQGGVVSDRTLFGQQLSTLDLGTALKAARALSSEIDRHALTDKLLHVCMENAGARTAWLILQEADALQVVASAAVGRPPSAAPVLPQLLSASTELPVTILQYVARTASPIVLRDAAREGRFRDEPHIVKRGSKSIACIPLLRQGRLTGLLHLENELTEGAFTDDRVESLQLIAAQAAISLENAALYEGLEARVRERTLALDAQNARMRLVLDNVGQGFMLARPTGVLSSHYSRILDEWFGPPAAHACLWDYLFGHEPALAATTEVLWRMLGDPMYPLQLSIDQLPTRITRRSRSYDVAYRPIADSGGALESVVVVVTDVTQTLLAAQAEAGRQELADMLDLAASDRAGFREFVDEGQRLVAALHGDQGRARRAIHTLKGNCALWRVRSVADLCEAIESNYAANDNMAPAQAEAVAQAFAVAVAKVERLISRHGDELGVRKLDYLAVVEAVTQHRPHHELEAMLAGWTQEPLATRFARLAHSAGALTQRAGKPPLRVVFDSEDLRSRPTQLAPLWAAFVHLLRNAVDHGIESPAERLALGKPATGGLVFRAHSEGERVCLELEDDGHGINWQAVRAKAQAAGLAAHSDADLERALFADGLTTREYADASSGRGLGLAAVREAVTALGGSIAVRSARGRGTCFTFYLPRQLFHATPTASARSSGAA